MKILYNVTVSIDSSIESEWKSWMIETHIPDVMATNKFISYSMQKIIGSENETGVSYAIQYISPSQEEFGEYQQEYAEKLQDEHKTRYEGKYAAFRTLMQIISHS